MLSCERCRAETYNSSTTLSGNVRTLLCNACSSEWDRKCREAPHFQAIELIDDTREYNLLCAMAGRSMEKGEFMGLLADRRGLVERMRLLAMEFIRPRPKVDTRRGE